MKINRVEIVAGVSFGLAIAQLIYDAGRIEPVTLILLGVAGAGFVLPELVSENGAFGKLKKVKLGQFEAEFEQQIRKAEESIIKAEQAPADSKPNFPGNAPPLDRSYVEEYERVISSPASNREKIILGGLLVERMAAETAKLLEIDITGLHSASETVRAINKGGFISESEVAAFDRFWEVRNFAVHSSGDRLTDEQTLRLLDLLWRLVRVFG